MFVFVHQRGSGPIRPGPSDFFCPFGYCCHCLFYGEKGEEFLFCFWPCGLCHPSRAAWPDAAQSRLRGADQNDSPAGPSPSGPSLRLSAALSCAKQLASGAAVPCCVKPPGQDSGHRAEQTRRSRAAGMFGTGCACSRAGNRKNPALPFLRRKDQPEPYWSPQPSNLPRLLPVG